MLQWGDSLALFAHLTYYSCYKNISLVGDWKTFCLGQILLPVTDGQDLKVVVVVVQQLCLVNTYNPSPTVTMCSPTVWFCAFAVFICKKQAVSLQTIKDSMNSLMRGGLYERILTTEFILIILEHFLFIYLCPKPVSVFFPLFFSFSYSLDNFHRMPVCSRISVSSMSAVSTLALSFKVGEARRALKKGTAFCRRDFHHVQNVQLVKQCSFSLQLKKDLFQLMLLLFCNAAVLGDTQAQVG